MKEVGPYRHLSPCPFCGNGKVLICHHVPLLKGSKIESWSFEHQCRRKAGETNTVIITGTGYQSVAEAEEGWSRGCRNAKKDR